MIKIKIALLYAIIIFAFIWEVIIIWLFLTSTQNIYWQISSIMLSIAAIIIRFVIVDPQIFSNYIIETDYHLQLAKKKLKPKRFINLMPIAMICCTIADIILPITFIGGMLIFLIAQILYIVALTGIIHLNPKLIFTGKSRTFSLLSTLSLLFITIIIYILFIFSSENIITIIIIPYIIAIILMVIITYMGVQYKSRSFKFRLMLCIGATFFFISDTILAYNKFNTRFYAAGILVGASYLIAVFLIQFAIMSLNIKKK